MRRKRCGFNPQVATRSSIPAWRIQGQRSLAGYSPQGCKELDTTEATQHACIYSVLVTQLCSHICVQSINLLSTLRDESGLIHEPERNGQEYDSLKKNKIYYSTPVAGFVLNAIVVLIHLIPAVKVKLLIHVRLFATPWTVAYQAPPTMGFSRQQSWSGLPFPSPGDLPNPGIKPRSPALQTDALPSEPPPHLIFNFILSVVQDT